MAPGENKKSTMDCSCTSPEDESAFSEKDTARSDAAHSESAVEKRSAIDDEYTDEPDETLAERLWGLTEMFPESIRTTTYNITANTSSVVKGFYSFSRSAVWIFVSSSVILFAPLIFEVERAQMEDMQRNHQKQMLLGPNTAVSGGQGGLPMPPIHR